MDNNSILNILLIILLVYVAINVIVILLMVLAIFLALRWFQGYISPDINSMQRSLDDLRRSNPQATTESLVGKIIWRQALKCGIVGAITGLGGFVTLPVALPIDIVVSLKLQATMVQFIAMLYGQGQPDSAELKLQTYMVMTGGVKVTETTFDVIMKFALRVLGDSLAKLIPFVGFIVGFAVNYFIAQATGNLAARWYMEQRPG